MQKRRIENKNRDLNTTESYDGQSLEEKVFQAVNSNAPIEAIAPMVYTERKEGVLPETNIRTDRFDIAQEAMTDIAKGIRTRRAKRILNKTDKPVSDSGNPTTQSVQNN